MKIFDPFWGEISSTCDFERVFDTVLDMVNAQMVKSQG